MPTPDDTVTLTVNDQMISGWTSVSITRGCERIPNSFELGLTSTNPTDGSQVVAYAGQSYSVAIGKDAVITGFIDRDTNGGDANGLLRFGRMKTLQAFASVHGPSTITSIGSLTSSAAKLTRRHAQPPCLSGAQSRYSLDSAVGVRCLGRDKSSLD